MALNDRSDQVVRAFVRSDLPENSEVSDKFGMYLTGELDLVQQVLSEANDGIPQVAEAAPASLRRGMIRYAVTPWNPLGTGYQGYVMYDGAAWQKFVFENALTTTLASYLKIDHTNFMTDTLGFTQLNSTPAAVEGVQIDPFIYVTTPAAESIGFTINTKTAGVFDPIAEYSDAAYIYPDFSIFPLMLETFDNGAAEAPYLTMHRFSSSPAANDLGGIIRFTGKDSAANFQVYTSNGMRIDSPTSGNEFATHLFYSVQAGAIGVEMGIGGGLTVGAGVTNKGIGTVNTGNTSGYYANGTLITDQTRRGTGETVQVVNTQNVTQSNATTVLPWDDTIPQNTEGVDCAINTAITPKSTTNKLMIDVTVTCANTVINQMTLALFQDTTANALNATMQQLSTANGDVTLHLRHFMAAGTTSATTFKARVGGNAAGTTTINGSASARKLGGVSTCSMTITEIQG